MPVRIFLSAGDDSGDLHAANLMRALRGLRADVEFIGLGKARMQEEGLRAPEGVRVPGDGMWLGNILRAGHYRGLLRACRRAMEGRRPALVIPVDFGGFNLPLCRAATALGIPVFYYIAPQVWAHGAYRLKKLRKWTRRVGLIYPFERALYERYRVEAEYVGHPLFDELHRHPPSEGVVADLRARFGPNLVGLFPGSRRQEVRAHGRILAEACRRVRRAVPDVSFAMLPGPGVRTAAGGALGEERFEVLEGVRPVELARASRLCIAKSGTVTLELASQGTPTAIFYRASPAVAFFAYGLSRTPYIGLINVLAGRVVCPERAMWRDEPGWVARQAVRLLTDESAREACRQGIREALAGFAQPGASARAARSALQLL